jgi:hypothetical protein
MARQKKLFKEIPTLWRPEFIPFYPTEKAKYKLNDKETLVYGFVRHFLKNCAGRFYFTNEQIRYALVGLDKDNSISRILRNLARKCPEITLEYEIKKGGGKTRLIGFKGVELAKMRVQNSQKSEGIESNVNSINNNYIGLKEIFERTITLNSQSPYYTLLIEEKKKFIDYWTEKSPNGKKERWQMEKVFDLKRRWGRWLRNVEKRINPKDYQKQEREIEVDSKNLKKLKEMKKSAFAIPFSPNVL